MPHEIQLRLAPEIAFDVEALERFIWREYGKGKPLAFKLLRRSIDARGKTVKVNLIIRLGEDGEELPLKYPNYQNVASSTEVHIIGAGPAGLFAALRLIELGLKPVILERGKNVRARRRDLAAITKNHSVNPESNYCFGEGGAGTYSDGKLYTRSNKRGDISGVLQTFFAHGAVEEILIDTHPHIGTNKLPEIIVAMRETILQCGGEVHFETRIDDFEIKAGKISSIKTAKGEHIAVRAVILATGHSARDIYRLLHRKGILLELKPFALGVRVEHPQVLIDSIQYHCDTRGAYLPPASYALVEQVNQRGVYSFCMCPGGIIAPCATTPGEVVTNGWSPSKRNNPFANSGIVVEIKPEDLKDFGEFGPLAGMEFQHMVEKRAWEAGGKLQIAPAQRMVDFCSFKVSSNLPGSSYQPGIVSTNLHDVLPQFVSQSLIVAFREFEKKMHGFFTNDAVLHATESRTSTPVRIPRDTETLMHVQVIGLFPSGEGAGYAGGIVSAAIDGQRCADAVQRYLDA